LARGEAWGRGSGSWLCMLLTPSTLFLAMHASCPVKQLRTPFRLTRACLYFHACAGTNHDQHLDAHAHMPARLHACMCARRGTSLQPTGGTLGQSFVRSSKQASASGAEKRMSCAARPWYCRTRARHLSSRISFT
jgi:hypothetical protein